MLPFWAADEIIYPQYVNMPRHVSPFWNSLSSCFQQQTRLVSSECRCVAACSLFLSRQFTQSFLFFINFGFLLMKMFPSDVVAVGEDVF